MLLNDTVRMVTACKWLLLLAVISDMGLECNGARILGIFSVASRSHMIAYQPLTTALAKRGHEVTVISHVPLKMKIENYTDIVVPEYWAAVDVYLKKLLNKNISKEEQAQLEGYGNGRKCRHFLSNPEVQRLIHAENEHFDLLILETELHECFLGFAHIYNLSIIGISAHSGTHWIHDLLGNSSPSSYVPIIYDIFTDRMTYIERVRNAYAVVLKIIRNKKENRLMQQVTRKFFEFYGPFPQITELQKRFALVLFNNDASLTFSRPMLTNVVDIAGMHIKPAKTLPKGLQTLLDKAKNGVIVFSMGTHVGELLQSQDRLEIFVDAFSKLKQLVLWKRNGTISHLPANVRMTNWLPQADVLAHPNVRVLVTHGGLLSMQEAIYHAKPIVGIPIYADQFFNVHRGQHRGYGILLDYGNLTSELLLEALFNISSQRSYLENAKIASARLRDQPMPPLEKAVYWTEYVIRHKGARHLRCAALDLTWYQYYLLDVVGALALGAILLVFTLYQVSRFIFTFMFTRRWCRPNILAEKSKVQHYSTIRAINGNTIKLK